MARTPSPGHRIHADTRVGHAEPDVVALIESRVHTSEVTVDVSVDRFNRQFPAVGHRVTSVDSGGSLFLRIQ